MDKFKQIKNILLSFTRDFSTIKMCTNDLIIISKELNFKNTSFEYLKLFGGPKRKRQTMSGSINDLLKIISEYPSLKLHPDLLYNDNFIQIFNDIFIELYKLIGISTENFSNFVDDILDIYRKFTNENYIYKDCSYTLSEYNCGRGVFQLDLFPTVFIITNTDSEGNVDEYVVKKYINYMEGKESEEKVSEGKVSRDEEEKIQIPPKRLIKENEKIKKAFPNSKIKIYKHEGFLTFEIIFEHGKYTKKPYIGDAMRAPLLTEISLLTLCINIYGNFDSANVRVNEKNIDIFDLYKEGWSPAISIENIIRKVLEYTRDKTIENIHIFPPIKDISKFKQFQIYKPQIGLHHSLSKLLHTLQLSYSFEVCGNIRDVNGELDLDMVILATQLSQEMKINNFHKFSKRQDYLDFIFNILDEKQKSKELISDQEKERQSCTNIKYSSIIFHTHPINSYSYPSIEDILKLIKHPDIIKTSVISTTWGIWILGNTAESIQITHDVNKLTQFLKYNTDQIGLGLGKKIELSKDDISLIDKRIEKIQGATKLKIRFYTWIQSKNDIVI